MIRIGLQPSERNWFICNGFTNIKGISHQYKLKVKYFNSYIGNLNKTFAAASTVAMRVYFNPIKMKRFIGVLHYFDQVLNAYHSILNIDNITAVLAMDYGTAYDMISSSEWEKDK